MQYVVLRKFKSYGVLYPKGSIVAEDKIRNPRLKLAEGKIVRVETDAVFSSQPAVAATDCSAGNVGADTGAAAANKKSEGSNKKKPLFVVPQ